MLAAQSHLYVEAEMACESGEHVKVHVRIFVSVARLSHVHCAERFPGRQSDLRSKSEHFSCNTSTKRLHIIKGLVHVFLFVLFFDNFSLKYSNWSDFHKHFASFINSQSL